MPGLGGEQWLPRNCAHSSAFDLFSREFGPLLGAYLCSRGYSTLEEVQNFLEAKLSLLPSPSVFKNLSQSAELLSEAIRNNKRILVYGDYDVDGMSALSLCSQFFDLLSFKNYELYIPHRFDEGYGVHVEALKRIKQRFDFDLVLTVDSGIGAIEPARYLREFKIPFIITDHHLPGTELPETSYIVNPNQGDCPSELGYICGATTVFFLLAGTKSILNADLKLDVFLDLLSLATVADQMELKGINRSLVREGLKRWPFRVRPALQCFASKLKSYEVRDIAFSVAPRLNAASRMGQAETALAFLRSKTLSEAERIHAQLEGLNSLRMASQALVHEEAREMARREAEEGSHLLILQGEEWAEGVLGIVASKLVEEFSLPTLLLSRSPTGSLRGSMRCPPGFHCVSFLEGAREFLRKFGGHAEAAGLELDGAKLEAFRAYAKSLRAPATALSRRIEFDGELRSIPSLMDVESLNRSAPWGRGNPEPVFLFEGLELSQRRVLKEKHIKWEQSDGSIIGFGFEDSCRAYEQAKIKTVDALVVPEISEFRGRQSVQLRMTRIRPGN